MTNCHSKGFNHQSIVLKINNFKNHKFGGTYQWQQPKCWVDQIKSSPCPTKEVLGQCTMEIGKSTLELGNLHIGNVQVR